MPINKIVKVFGSNLIDFRDWSCRLRRGCADAEHSYAISHEIIPEPPGFNFVVVFANVFEVFQSAIVRGLVLHPP